MGRRGGGSLKPRRFRSPSEQVGVVSSHVVDACESVNGGAVRARVDTQVHSAVAGSHFDEM